MTKEQKKVLEAAAALVKKAVTQDKADFVRRVVGEIRCETLDSHFLVRSVEVNYSVDWDSEWNGDDPAVPFLMQLFNQRGLQGFADLKPTEFNQHLEKYTDGGQGGKKKRPPNIYFWVTLAQHGFVRPEDFAKVLQELAAEGFKLPDTEKAFAGMITIPQVGLNEASDFLKRCKASAGNSAANRFYEAVQKIAAARVMLRFPNRFIHRILRNCEVLTRDYSGHYQTLLESQLKSRTGKGGWNDVRESRPEDWEKTPNAPAAWAKLKGVGENVFFYILRDINFGSGTSTHGFVKYDLQNIGFFCDNHLNLLLPELGAKQVKRNADARKILGLIFDEIVRTDPAFREKYTLSHLNAAIYQPD